MANLFTLDKIGIDFVTKHGGEYKFLLQSLCAKIKDKEAESSTVRKNSVHPSLLIFHRNSWFLH